MVALIQGIYFVVTGIWSLVHILSFQKVTGPKTDLWLVKTVGVLVIAIGAGLIVAAVDQKYDTSIVTIAMASAVGLTSIDVVYVFKRRIWKIYLADAVVEIGFLIWWIVYLYFD